jgi:hypothetical protein
MSDLIDALTSNRVASLAEVGEDAIWDQLDDIATSPALPFAIELIATAWPIEHAPKALKLLDTGLERNTSPLAFSETLDIAIETNQQFLAAVTDTIRRCCGIRTTDRRDATSAYFASAATTALIRLAIRGDEASQYSLLATLLDVTVDDDDTFRTTGARCSGIAYEHFRVGAVVPVLERLADNEQDGGEAAQQLGLISLVQAFDGTVIEARPALERAASWFERARNDDGRTDAALYLPVVRALLGLLEQDDAAAAAATQEIPSAAAARAMWDDAIDRYEWSRPRRNAEAEWATLVTSVQSARVALASDTWLLNAATSLIALADAYKATRAITLNDTTSGGVTRVIEPTINAATIRRQELATYLDQALATDTIEIDADLRQLLRDRLRTSAEDPPGIPLGGDGTVLSTLIEVPTVTAENQSGLAALEQVAADRTAGGPPDPLFDSVLGEVLGDLQPAAAFPPEARDVFIAVLTLVMRFVRMRMDVTRSFAASRTGYLWQRDSPPLEKSMVQDLHEFLSASPLQHGIEVEVSNLGSGRVDLLIHWNGWIVIVEGKRSGTYVDYDVAHGLVAGQALAYQATGMSATIALTLDYSTPGSGVARHFSSCAWVDTVTDDSGAARHVVMLVLPGARTPPSSANTRAVG